MLKVLFVSHSSHWGGAEKCLHLLLKGLPRDEFEPLVVLPGSNDLKLAIESLGVRTIQGPHLPWVRPWMDFCRDLHFETGVAELVDVIQQEQVDVVFSNTSVVVGGALAARQCKIPHVWHVLEMLSSDPIANPAISFREFHLLLHLMSDRIVAASAAVRDDIKKHVDAQNIEVIHTGIELSGKQTAERSKARLFGVPEDTFVVSFVGDLSERKGVRELLQAAPAVLARNPDTLFVVAGRDAESGDAVRAQITDNGLGDAVRLLGFRSDVESIMAASDVFVLPTLADPLPLVVQEAMSVGTPVIATRSGGCEDMIVDGETGYLIATRDSDAIAQSIISLMDSPADRERMGQRGRDRLEKHFSHGAYVEKMSNLLRNAADSQLPPRPDLQWDDFLRLQVQWLDAWGANHTLKHWNTRLRQENSAIENSISTRVGRTLTWPLRKLYDLMKQ